MSHEKSCGAVVFTKNADVKYLLLHYEAGHWDFVKGNVEPNESERDTVLRELEEETGIVEAKFVEGFREEINYFYRREGKTIYKEVAFFLIQTHDDEVKLSYEHLGYKWLNCQEALEALTYGNAKRVLRKAHEFLKTQRIANKHRQMLLSKNEEQD